MTEAVNMADFIAAKSDQLNADDLMDAPRTITVTKVTASPDAAEQPVSIHYEGDGNKPFKPCKTMRRILVGVWGKDASKYVGRSMTLYRDPAVAFGGLQVGGIRISHMSDIAEDKTVALLVTRGRKAPFKIKPLVMQRQQPATTGDDEQALALQKLTEAANEGIEALGNVWKQKWLAPHRDALQFDLERLKAIAAKRNATGAAQEGEPTEAQPQPDRPTEPDTNTNDAFATALKNIANAVSEREVDAIDKDTELDRNFMSPEQVTQLDEALAKRREELRVKEAAE